MNYKEELKAMAEEAVEMKTLDEEAHGLIVACRQKIEKYERFGGRNLELEIECLLNALDEEIDLHLN